MNDPDRYPVEGRPFEPYCRFEVCLADEPHMAWCPQHESNLNTGEAPDHEGTT